MLDQQGKVVTSDKLAEEKSEAALTHLPTDPAREIPPDVYIRGLIQQELLNLIEGRLGSGTNSMHFNRSGLWFGADSPTAAVMKILLNGKIKIPIHDYAGGTTGGMESDSDLEDGMIYIAQNFGGAGTHKLRARIGSAWKEATLS